MKKCKQCGTDMSHKSKQARFCSKKCKKQAEYLRLNPIIIKTCIHCEGEFETRKKKSRFCSQACVNTSLKKHDDVILECGWCQKDFIKPYIYRERRFCSKSCSTKFTNDSRDNVEVGKKISKTKKEQYANGRIHPWSGKHHSKETKEKISETRIKNGKSAGENNPMFGKRHSKETREKISKTRSQKIVNGEYNGWFLKGKIFSEKMNKEIVFRSSWERNFIKELDNDPEVVSFIFEPFSVQYYDTTEERNRHYIPDFLVVYKNGSNIVVEIKPSYYLDAQVNKDKFKAMQEHCKKTGMLFEVKTEKSLGI